MEARFIAAEQKNVELEQQINQVQLETSCAEREVSEFSEKISQLNAKLTEVEEEKNLLSSQMQEYLEKVSQLESDLNQSSLRSTQLEEELRAAREKCTEHEDRASMNHQRSRELEDLFSRVKSFADLETTHIVQNLKASSLPGEIEVGDHVDPCWFRRGTSWTCLNEAAILSAIRTV